MTPEARAREQIDNRLRQSGWTIQDLKQLNLTVASGVAVREFPTNTGPVDYALFIEGVPVGVVEAKKDEAWIKRAYKIRFAYKVYDALCRRLQEKVSNSRMQSCFYTEAMIFCLCGRICL